MRRTLAARLRCPACHATPLEARPEGLGCPGCDHFFPVVRGRPILIAEGPLAELTAAAASLPHREAYQPSHISNGTDVEDHFFRHMFPKLLRRDPHWRFLGAKARDIAETIPAGASVLDIGAGEGKYGALLPGRDYVAADLVFSSDQHDFSAIEVIADAAALPFRDGSFDAALNLVVMEHVPEPQEVVSEMARVLRPGGQVFALIPLVRPEHLAPYDFHRFTRYGIERMFSKSGLRVDSIEPSNGALWTAAYYGRIIAQTRPLEKYGNRSLAGILLNRIWTALLWPFVAYARATNAAYGDDFPIYFWVRATAMKEAEPEAIS